MGLPEILYLVTFKSRCLNRYPLFYSRGYSSESSIGSFFLFFVFISGFEGFYLLCYDLFDFYLDLISLLFWPFFSTFSSVLVPFFYSPLSFWLFLRSFYNFPFFRFLALLDFDLSLFLEIDYSELLKLEREVSDFYLELDLEFLYFSTFWSKVFFASSKILSCFFDCYFFVSILFFLSYYSFFFIYFSILSLYSFYFL